MRFEPSLAWERLRSRIWRKAGVVATDSDGLDAMLGAYRHAFFLEVPTDDRIIDPERLASIRDRLTDKYYYRWRQHDANGELLDALFHTQADSKGTRWGLSIGKIYRNAKGHSPPLGMRFIDDDEYKLNYYVTVQSMNIREAITDFDDANRLLVHLLPNCDYTMRKVGGQFYVTLEQDGYEGRATVSGVAALAIVLSIIDYFIARPSSAPPWRTI